MKKAEWAPLARLLAHCWKGDFDPEKADSYFVLLKDLEASAVEAALVALTNDPKAWMPTVPEIKAAVRQLEDPAVPSWVEAWHLIQVAMGKATVEAGEEWLLVGGHPAVLAFVRMQGGLSWFRLAPLFDDDYGPLRVKELEARWEDFIDRAEARVRTGRSLAELVGAERSGGQPRTLAAAFSRLALPESRQLKEGE